jgi:hypothetical protein
MGQRKTTKRVQQKRKSYQQIGGISFLPKFLRIKSTGDENYAFDRLNINLNKKWIG